MKKNAMLKIAAILMVAVLLTTCAISSTFAKYVTAKEISTEARVAKFGYTLDTTFTGTTFTQTYASETDGFTGDVVSSANDDLMVAPGTSGDLSYNSQIAVDTNRAPEVAVTIKSDVKFTWTDGTNDYDYCPIIFTIDGVKYMTKDLDPNSQYESTEQLLNAVSGALSFEYTLAPGATGVTIDGTEVSVADLFAAKTVTWEWEYDHTTAGSESANEALDAKDTALGNEDFDVKLGVVINQSITQID